MYHEHRRRRASDHVHPSGKHRPILTQDTSVLVTSGTLISASGTVRPAERRSVAIRRPGWTAGRISLTCEPSSAPSGRDPPRAPPGPRNVPDGPGRPHAGSSRQAPGSARGSRRRGERTPDVAHPREWADRESGAGPDPRAEAHGRCDPGTVRPRRRGRSRQHRSGGRARDRVSGCSDTVVGSPSSSVAARSRSVQPRMPRPIGIAAQKPQSHTADLTAALVRDREAELRPAGGVIAHQQFIDRRRGHDEKVVVSRAASEQPI